jgi:20S proteasome alpha/beta subunit
MILAGFAEDDPAVYVLKLPEGGVDRQIAGRASIGLGNLCEFFRNLHDESMTTNQRVQLAHFCLSLTARYSYLVKEPIDITVLSRDGLREYKESELLSFQQRSTAMVEQVVSSILGQLNDDRPTK